MAEPASRPIRFVHRGAIVEVTDAPTTQSVLYWLRESAHRVGTKEGCNEGDCGACMVIVGERDDAAPDGVALRPVNSCLPFLSTLDGRALLTVEDLPTTAAGEPHPTQAAMVACHGSQCGFCTPGFTMSLAACYDDHVAAGTKPSRREVADTLAGNLCRCTGYRPILDAGESMFGLPGASIDRKAIRVLLDRLADDPSLFYRAPESALAKAQGADAWVAAPRTIAELSSIRAEHPDARLVAGATDVGLWVTKQFRPMPKMIRVDRVEALKRIVDDGRLLTIGAGASLESAWDALVAVAPSLREMQLRFAAPPLRRAGTMGGNVANGSPIGDSAPVLLALDATLVLRCGHRTRRIALCDFYVDYMQTRLDDGEWIAAIEVPHPAAGTAIRAYKLGKRYDCDISAVSAGLAVRVRDGLVTHARVAFGGMAAIVKRAKHAERALLQRAWDEVSVERAVDALASDFTPLADLRASADYRRRAAGNLLRRFWLETRAEAPLATRETSVWTRESTADRAS